MDELDQSQAANVIPRDMILDKALDLAEADSWERLHLYDIALDLDITLDHIRRYFPQKDDLVEAWFDRADSTVLKETPTADFLRLDRVERLHQVIMNWFGALARHRRITKQMLAYKLEPGHIHLQVLGILRVSRTVQWFRETAQLESYNLQRILEEIAITSIYLMSFSYWLYDESHESIDTRKFLDKHLRRADSLTGWLP